MNDRHNDLLRIRPVLKKTLEFDTMSIEERFQNSTLRPVIKLQNPLLIEVFRNYINKHKGVFYELGLGKAFSLYGKRFDERSKIPQCAKRNDYRAIYC